MESSPPGASRSLASVARTGAALEALAGVQGARAHRVRAHAARFIAANQNPDGRFPSIPGGNSNAQSTAWAVQGVVAAGADPAGLHLRGARSPLGYLRSLQAPDGHIRYARGPTRHPCG
jgi:energy-coupling factor transport system substrate-specific component